jgi:hypothetical protein
MAVMSAIVRSIGPFHVSVTSEPCAKQRRESGSRSRGAGRGTRAERDTAVGSRAPTAARSGRKRPVRIVVAVRRRAGRMTRDLPASRNAMMSSFPVPAEVSAQCDRRSLEGLFRPFRSFASRLFLLRTFFFGA